MLIPQRNTALSRGLLTPLVLFAVALALGGCSTIYPMMPTPVIYTGAQPRPPFPNTPAEYRTPPLDLLYITDRAPAAGADDEGPYTAERSRSTAFGSTTVQFGNGVSWDMLAAQNGLASRTMELNLTQATYARTRASSGRCGRSVGPADRLGVAAVDDMVRAKGEPGVTRFLLVARPGP